MNTTQSFQGNGFDHNRGQSNNAINAQANGLIPGSGQLKRELVRLGYKGVPAKFLTAHAPSCEYHHHGMPVAGSKYVTTVRYYDLAEVVNWLNDPSTQAEMEAFKKADKRIDGCAFMGIVEFKEYRCLGAYNSKSLHLVRVLAAVHDSGSQWTIEVLAGNCLQRMVWCNSRYGRSDSSYTSCSWYRAGDSISKAKDNVAFLAPKSSDEIAELLKAEKKAAALAKRRATILAKREAAAQEAAQAKAAADRQAAFQLLDEMKQQFMDAGADFERYGASKAAWFIYSRFFEGLPSKPDYITCGMIKNWIKQLS